MLVLSEHIRHLIIHLDDSSEVWVITMTLNPLGIARFRGEAALTRHALHYKHLLLLQLLVLKVTHDNSKLLPLVLSHGIKTAVITLAEVAHTLYKRLMFMFELLHQVFYIS